MFQRRLVTTLQTRIEPQRNHVDISEHPINRLSETKGHELQLVYRGQPIWILNNTQTSQPGLVVKSLNEPRSYIVETSEGTRVRRNRQHLRTTLLHLKKTITSTHREADEAAPPCTARERPATENSANQVAASDICNMGPVDDIPGTTCTRSGSQVKPPSRYFDER